MNSSSELLTETGDLREAPAATADAPPWQGSAASSAPLRAVIPVWDPALRLFHWSLAAAVAGAIATGEIGGPWIEWHARLGELIAGLLGFRLVWGVLGPDTARFASFVSGPAAIRAYLRGRWQGIGHNPLGAWAVLGLLALGALQAGSGVFANDDIAFQGPLAGLVGSAWSDRAGAWHQKLSWLLIGVVGLHVCAILWYRVVKRQDLVGPMITGVRRSPALAHSVPVSPAPTVWATLPWRWPRLAAALAGSALTVGIASGTFLAGTGTPVPAAPAASAVSSASAAVPATAKPAW